MSWISAGAVPLYTHTILSYARRMLVGGQGNTLLFSLVDKSSFGIVFICLPSGCRIILCQYQIHWCELVVSIAEIDSCYLGWVNFSSGSKTPGIVPVVLIIHAELRDRCVSL